MTPSGCAAGSAPAAAPPRRCPGEGGRGQEIRRRDDGTDTDDAAAGMWGCDGPGGHHPGGQQVRQGEAGGPGTWPPRPAGWHCRTRRACARRLVTTSLQLQGRASGTPGLTAWSWLGIRRAPPKGREAARLTGYKRLRFNRGNAPSRAAASPRPSDGSPTDAAAAALGFPGTGACRSRRYSRYRACKSCPAVYFASGVIPPGKDDRWSRATNLPWEHINMVGVPCAGAD